jgi:hypothetical protein
MSKKETDTERKWKELSLIGSGQQRKKGDGINKTSNKKARLRKSKNGMSDLLTYLQKKVILDSIKDPVAQAVEDDDVNKFIENKRIIRGDKKPQ